MAFKWDCHWRPCTDRRWWSRGRSTRCTWRCTTSRRRDNFGWTWFGSGTGSCSADRQANTSATPANRKQSEILPFMIFSGHRRARTHEWKCHLALGFRIGVISGLLVLAVKGQIRRHFIVSRIIHSGHTFRRPRDLGGLAFDLCKFSKNYKILCKSLISQTKLTRIQITRPLGWNKKREEIRWNRKSPDWNKRLVNELSLTLVMNPHFRGK